MLNLSNISVSFGGRDLYKNISFQINNKDKIGVVGKNGAGKSTSFVKIVLALKVAVR